MADQQGDSQPTNETPAAPEAPAARPQPAFGEYAPEGWEWKPEGAEETGSAVAAAAVPGSAAGSAPASSTGRVEGVPHNLGAGSSGSGSNPAAAPAAPQQPKPSGGDPEPYRATAAPAAAPTPVYIAQPGQPGAPKSRTADRVITILLLGLGAVGAMFTANTMLALSNSYALMADVFGLDDFEVPGWVGTLGTVSAIAFIALFAVVLIFSIQRMRARKLTFWVPLTAGAVALVAMFVLIYVPLAGIPELASQMGDPDALQRMLDYLSTPQ